MGPDVKNNAPTAITEDPVILKQGSVLGVVPQVIWEKVVINVSCSISFWYALNPFPYKPVFLCAYATSLLKTLVGK